jgi:hypothetical protein
MEILQLVMVAVLLVLWRQIGSVHWEMLQPHQSVQIFVVMQRLWLPLLATETMETQTTAMVAVLLVQWKLIGAAL